MISKTLTKLLVIFIILVVTSSVLILTSRSTIIPQNVIVPNKTETLFSLLEESNNTVVTIFQQLDEDGITLPQESIIEYEKANVLAAESQILVNAGNYSNAEISIIQALDKLKDALRIAYESIQDQPIQPATSIEKYVRIQSSIKRYSELIDRIQNQTILVSSSGFNTTSLRDKIQTIISLLNSATANLEKSRFEAALKNVAEAKSLSDSVIVVLRDFAITLKIPRLETYIVNTEKRLILIRQTTTSLSATYPATTIDASYLALDKAENSLSSAKSFFESNQINDTLNELVKSKISEDQAVNYLRSDDELESPALSDSSQIVPSP